MKTFDELLNGILTDYKNQFPEADTAQGSLIFIKSACYASALWGLYQYQEWIRKQMFPDTADSEYLEHHAWVRGLTRKPGETDADLLTRLLEFIQRPPAGGNKYDYEKWALEISHVKAAYCYPLAQGLGTVDVVVIADDTATGSEIPSSHTLAGSSTAVTANKLVDSAVNFGTPGAPIVRIGDVVKNATLGTQATVTAIDSATQLSLSTNIFTAIGQAYSIKSLTIQVKEHIDAVKPVTAIIRSLAPTILTQDVTMTVTGDVNKTTISTNIQAYAKALKPGDTLYRAKLIAIAMAEGASNVVVTVPAADVMPTAYQMVRTGVITVA